MHVRPWIGVGMAMAVGLSLLIVRCADEGGAGCEGPDAPPSCGEACSEDMDCGTGLYCSDGACTADCVPGGDQCGAGQRCDAWGRCAQITDPLPCQSSAPPAECGKACKQDADCGPYLYCGADGKCTAECIDQGDQCDQGYYCPHGKCIKRPGVDCPDVTVSLSPVTPNVMLLIDQSGSMDDNFGSVGGKKMDRWQAVRYALTDSKVGVVTRLQKVVRFAATLYHSKGGSAGGTCPILTQSAGTGQPKLNNRAAIDSLLGNNKPEMDTPTAESVDGVVKQMKLWAPGGPDGKNDPKVLVLATDGDPDNCKDPNAHDATSQKLTETAVQSAYKAGIKTYALSVGSDVSTTHLNKVANAGLGKPLTPKSAPFFRGNDPAELVTEFDKVIRGLRTCTFKLDQKVAPQYAKSGKVSLNGTPLIEGTDWELKDNQTILLKGKACATFKSDDSVNLVAKFPCGAVLE